LKKIGKEGMFMKQLRIFLIFIALSFATMLFAAEKTTTFKVKGIG